MESQTTVVTSDQHNIEEYHRPDEVAGAISSPQLERSGIDNAESLYNINLYFNEDRTNQIFNKHHAPDEVADAISPREQERMRLDDAESLYSVNVPPTEAEVELGEKPSPEEAKLGEVPKPKTYPPFGFEVLSSLIPGSILGVLARLGLLAITTYDGQSIFSLAWVQAAGCFVMGLALGLRDQIGALCVLSSLNGCSFVNYFPRVVTDPCTRQLLQVSSVISLGGLKLITIHQAFADL